MFTIRFETLFADLSVILLIISVIIIYITRTGIEARFVREYYKYREENKDRKVTLDEIEAHLSRYRLEGYGDKIRSYYSYSPSRLREEYKKARLRNRTGYLLILILIISTFL